MQIAWLAADSFAPDQNALDFWNQPAMFVYSTIFNILLYRLCWGIDIGIWSHYGVNYISVLELSNIKSNLLFVINQTTTFLTLFFISLLVFYRANGSKTALDNTFVSFGSPILLLVTAIAIQLYQTFFYYKGDSSRGLFNKRVVVDMLCAPFIPLTFRDAYGADVLTSFTKIIADALYAGCWVISGSFVQRGVQDQHTAHFGSDYMQCKSDDMIMTVTILQVTPLIIRFLQCIRGIYETKAVFPFAFNAWKYMLSILVVVFAVEQWADKNTYIFLVVMTTLYKSWWDVAMDWGLVETVPRSWAELCNIGNWSHKKFFLRSSIMYPYPSVYYACIVLNLILRFIWVLSLAPMTYLGGMVGAKLSLFMGSMEIIRRSIWGIFRVEWEHVKCCRNDTPGYLPTHILRQHEYSARYGVAVGKDDKSGKIKNPNSDKDTSTSGKDQEGISRKYSVWQQVPQQEETEMPLTVEMPLSAQLADYDNT